MLKWQCRQIWMAKGPSGPRVVRERILILPAGNIHKPEGTHSRKWGPGGDAYEHPPTARCSSKETPGGVLPTLPPRAK